MEPTAFKSLVETASDIIYRVDRSGRIQYVNTAVSSVLGYSADEVTGMRALGFVAPGGANRILSLYRREFGSPRESFYVEIPVIGKDGQLVWLGQHVYIVRERGRVVAVEVIARDISEHQRLAELQTGQKCLLELIARGKPLIEILDTLTYFLEAQVPNSSVALVVLDAKVNLLRPLVSPGLSEASIQLIESIWSEELPLPEALDAHPKDRLIETDTRTDELWKRHAAAQTFEFSTCWTVPVQSKDRAATGILGLFHHDHIHPTDHDHRLLDVASQIAGIAIERDRMERNVRIELKRKVAERTIELEHSNRQLRQEIEDRLEAERAL
ncbi:MAG: PAS domain S-box protein, partial [Rhodothermales bacterium]